MLYRNLLSMDTEEALRSLPVDGAVLMGGCDKTTPGLLMGAISMDLPAIYSRRARCSAATGTASRWAAGPIFGSSGPSVARAQSLLTIGTNIENGIARSPGFCMTMGTASTMTALAEALGFTLPGASSIPAPDSNHTRMAMNCGERAVQMVWDDWKPSDILTLQSFENAIAVDMAIGGSTNAFIHLAALARALRSAARSEKVRSRFRAAFRCWRTSGRPEDF